MKLLVREIEEVDGASVEQWERVERFPDPRPRRARNRRARLRGRQRRDSCGAGSSSACANEFGSRLGRRAPRDEAARAGRRRHARRVGARRARGRHRRVAGGRGRRLRSRRPRGRAAAANGAVLLVGRDGHPFRRRERHQLLALARHRRPRPRVDARARRCESAAATPAVRRCSSRSRFAAPRPGRARRRARGSARAAPRRARRARPRACTAQPGSWSCAQSWNRHCGASASMSANARRNPSSATHSVTARRPGVSTSTPPSGSSTSSRAVVVCRPRWSLARTSPVACTSAPTSPFTSVDFPTPTRRSARPCARSPRTRAELVDADAGHRARDDHRRARRAERSTAARSIGAGRRDRPSSARSPGRRRSRTRARAHARAGAGSGRSRTTA